MKIDKSFIIGMLAEDESAVIVRSTIELGHNLGLRVIAEGVESAEIWQELLPLGCDLLQGYHLSRPMKAEDTIAWTAAWTTARAADSAWPVEIPKHDVTVDPPC